jgi:hypothetical protein
MGNRREETNSMSQVKTLFGEQNGAILEARITKTEHQPYTIEFFINGKYTASESFPGVSIHYVESAAENWLQGIKVLNG